MKNAVISMIFGAVGAILVTTFVQKSFATTQTAQVQEAIRTGLCQVEVGPSSMVGGNQCFGQQVMTGAWQGYLYCANIQVICN